MENNSDSEVECAYNSACSLIVPAKSRSRYEGCYNNFIKWLESKNREINEKTMLAYFVQRQAILKSPGSLWSEYSMLRSMVNVQNNINISKFTKLIAFLKSKSSGYRKKNQVRFPDRI